MIYMLSIVLHSNRKWREIGAGIEIKTLKPCVTYGGHSAHVKKCWPRTRQEEGVSFFRSKPVSVHRPLDIAMWGPSVLPAIPSGGRREFFLTPEALRKEIRERLTGWWDPPAGPQPSLSVRFGEEIQEMLHG